MIRIDAARFDGLFALPHFALTEYMYSSTQKLLSRTLLGAIESEGSRSATASNLANAALDQSSETAASSYCEFVLYVQQHAVRLEPRPNFPSIGSVEYEMRFPSGSRLPPRSPLKMSMVAFSPDCGFVIVSRPQDLVGRKAEDFYVATRHAVMGFSIMLAIELWCLLKQIKGTCTPSTRNRISMPMLAALSLGDGLAFLLLIFMPLYVEVSQPILYTAAFLALLLVLLELRFLMDVWTVQATEQERRTRHAQGRPAPDGGHTSSGLPAPATTQWGEIPSSTSSTFSPNEDIEQSGRSVGLSGDEARTASSAQADLATLYTRYCFALLIIFFTILYAASFRRRANHLFYESLCVANLSLWWPQIYHNVMRNCRKALRWDFVILQSLIRFIPMVYFYAVPENVFLSRTDLRMLAILFGWLCLQTIGLFSQEMFGPRFAIRKGWAPPAYDYHPILHEDEEAPALPSGWSRPPDSGTGTGQFTRRLRAPMHGITRTFNCTVCAQGVEVPTIPKGASEVGTTGWKRRSYMVTPCRHIFHAGCLEGWMRYRLQCPNCRETIPPR